MDTAPTLLEQVSDPVLAAREAFRHQAGVGQPECAVLARVWLRDLGGGDAGGWPPDAVDGVLALASADRGRGSR